MGGLANDGAGAALPPQRHRPQGVLGSLRVTLGCFWEHSPMTELGLRPPLPKAQTPGASAGTVKLASDHWDST